MANGCASMKNKSSTTTEDPICVLPKEDECNRSSHKIWDGLSIFELEDRASGSSTSERAQVPTESDKSNGRAVDQGGSKMPVFNVDNSKEDSDTRDSSSDASSEDYPMEGSERSGSLSDSDSTSDEDWKVDSQIRGDARSYAKSVERRTKPRRISKNEDVAAVHTDNTEQRKPKRRRLVKRWAVSADNVVQQMERRQDTWKSVAETSEISDDDWKWDSNTQDARSNDENVGQHMTMRSASKKDGVPAVSTDSVEQHKPKRRRLVKRWSVNAPDAAENEVQNMSRRRDTGNDTANGPDAYHTERKHMAGKGVFIPCGTDGMKQHTAKKHRAGKIWIETLHSTKKKQKHQNTKRMYTLDTGNVWLERQHAETRRINALYSVAGTIARHTPSASVTRRKAENLKDKKGINIGRLTGLSKKEINRKFEIFLNNMQEWDKINDGHVSNALPGDIGERRGHQRKAPKPNHSNQRI